MNLKDKIDAERQDKTRLNESLPPIFIIGIIIWVQTEHLLRRFYWRCVHLSTPIWGSCNIFAR